ncbi:unnamed protein product [Merluccius merluccius]
MSESILFPDVVAYVDVWSSNKTENYSKPFIDQLREMGAEVSKTFTKHVTHVVFKDGHQATWNKAKKIGAKLVSVLWLARCKDEATFVDEELFPAQNDEGNRLIKKRTHRCMQPKDFAEKTPEYSRRMKKKLDQMVKDLAPQSPLLPDVSPYIIDEENGIVYSPSLKRSVSMAQRLKEMREKRENLSPTDGKSDDDDEEESSSSLVRSHPHHSPDERGESNFTDVDTGTHQTTRMPWLSPCTDVPKRKSLIHFKKQNSEDRPPEEEHLHRKTRRSSMKKELLKKQSGSEIPCQDPIAELPETLKTPKLRQSKLIFDNKKEEHLHRKTRRSSMKKELLKKQSGSEVPCQDPIAELPETLKTPKLRQSKLKFDNKSGHLPDDVKLGRQKTKQVTSSKTHTITSLDNLNPPSCLSSPAVQNTQVNQELAKGDIFQLKKADLPAPKNKRNTSLSALARKFTFPSESLSVATSLPETEENDNVFEDYFSPANHNSIQERPSLSSLPAESRIQLPFELASVSGKRKQRKSGTTAPHKKKQNETQSSSDRQWQSNPVPSIVVGPTGGPAHPANAKSRRKTLPVMNTDDFETQVVRHRATRTLVMTSMSTDKQQTVTQVVKLLGGFSIVDRVCETTTHVVSDGYRRTLNVLLGIARGCWILSFEWVCC